MTSLLQTYGLLLLFVLVLLESGGLPLPGETALIAAAVLAERGHFSIAAVIAVAAAAAIVGDNGGYWVGRRYGRRILARWAWLERLSARVRVRRLRARGARGASALAVRAGLLPLEAAAAVAVALNGLVHRGAERVLPPSERFFARHGSKTVFVGRFVAVLRFTAAWMAGVARMRWWTFLAWNAAGGIAWAVLVGLVAFYLGRAAADAISRYGLYGAAAAIVLVALLLAGIHLWRRRMVTELDPPGP